MSKHGVYARDSDRVVKPTLPKSHQDVFHLRFLRMPGSPRWNTKRAVSQGRGVLRARLVASECQLRDRPYDDSPPLPHLTTTSATCDMVASSPASPRLILVPYLSLTLTFPPRIYIHARGMRSGQDPAHASPLYRMRVTSAISRLRLYTTVDRPTTLTK